MVAYWYCTIVQAWCRAVGVLHGHPPNDHNHGAPHLKIALIMKSPTNNISGILFQTQGMQLCRADCWYSMHSITFPPKLSDPHRKPWTCWKYHCISATAGNLIALFEPLSIVVYFCCMIHWVHHQKAAESSPSTMVDCPVSSKKVRIVHAAFEVVCWTDFVVIRQRLLKYYVKDIILFGSNTSKT